MPNINTALSNFQPTSNLNSGAPGLIGNNGPDFSAAKISGSGLADRQTVNVNDGTHLGISWLGTTTNTNAARTVTYCLDLKTTNLGPVCTADCTDSVNVTVGNSPSTQFNVTVGPE